MDERRTPRLSPLAEAAYVAFLPAVLFLAYRVSPINQLGLLDPWIYTGLVNNFADLVDRYGLTYYAVRFGLILPHLVLAETLGPVAGYMASCYLLYLIAGVPLYLLFRKRYSVEAAIFAYALLVSSVWLARTVLWTHPDAAAVPYTLAAVSLLLFDPARRAPTFFAIGLLFALAANSNIFSLTISGLSGVAYLILHAGNLRNRLAKDVAWMVTGIVAVFALGWIGYLACCGTPDFIRPTRHMIRWGFSGAGELYRVPFSLTLIAVDYVYLPLMLVGALALSTVVIRKQDRIFAAGAGYFLAAVAFISWWQFASRGVVLELFYYFSFLLPPTFVCAALIAVRLCSARGAESGRRWLLVSAATVVLLPLLHVYGVLDFSTITRQAYLAIFGIALGTIAVGRWVTIVPPVGALLFSAAMHAHWNVRDPLHTGVSASPYYGIWGGKGKMEIEAYRLAVGLIDAMPRVRQDGKPIFFWYPNRDPLINSLQSTFLWGYSRLHSTDRSTLGMPRLTPADMQKLTVSGQPWLVLVDRSKEGIAAGTRALRESGFVLNESRHSSLCSGGLCVELSVSTVEKLYAGKPFPGSNGPSGPRAAHLLFAMQTPSLLPQFQPKLHGKLRKLQNRVSAMLPGRMPQYKLAELMPEGYLLFRPTNSSDYIATEFLVPTGAEAGGSSEFRLRIGRDPRFVPSPRCRIQLQNHRFEALSEFACRESNDAARTEEQRVFRLAEIPEKLRIVITTRDANESALPVRIELAQAVSPRE
jgi:hypothetical protein